MPRVYVALAVPSAIEQQLRLLRTDLPGTGWLREYYLTTNFVGDVPRERVSALTDAFAGFEIEPFKILLSGARGYPDDKPPRALWVGVDDDARFAG